MKGTGPNRRNHMPLSLPSGPFIIHSNRSRRSPVPFAPAGPAFGGGTEENGKGNGSERHVIRKVNSMG